MAIHINRLNGGNIVIGSSGGGASGHPETRFTLEGGTVETANITGTLDKQWMIDNEYQDGELYDWIKTITHADIGSTVTSLGTEVFLGCSSLTNVTIPDSVTSIGESAFAECSGLTSVTIGNSVTSIGDGAFATCSSLTSVTIPSSVTSIGRTAFAGCSGLTSVTIPDCVTSIGDSAFSGCSRLISVTIVATGKPGASAESVKHSMINNGVYESVTWNMPS